VLTEQLKQTRDRFNVGEVTRTDVAQAETRSSDRNTRESTALLTMPRFSLAGPFLLNENYTKQVFCKTFTRLFFKGMGLGFG
jgi:hypothetical protein